MFCANNCKLETLKLLMRKHLKTFISITIVSLFFTSCASVYHSINPTTLDFQSKSGDSSFRVEYQTNLLTGKYAKREIKSDVYLIAVKVTNNSGREIILRNNLKILSGEKEVTSMALSSFYDATQQNPEKSLMFLFITPLNAYSFSQTTDAGQVTSQKIKFFPIGIILGPVLSLVNRAEAKAANKKFKNELDKNDILERVIPAGHIDYGLIAIRDVSSSDLIFKINF
jgi:hypothetical protein